MISSGKKRGLAVAAISALAVTGVPGIAYADSLDTVSATALVSVSDAGAVSIENDGNNTTVSLVAVAPASVTSIQFRYAPAGTDPAVNPELVQNAGTAVSRSESGEFKTEWAPNVNLLNTNVDIYAQAVDGVGNPVGTPGADAIATSVLISGSVDAVDLDDKAALGYFVQPYADGDATTVGDGGAREENVAGVTGSTSGTDVDVVAGVGTTAGAVEEVIDDRPQGAPAGTPADFATTVNLTDGQIDTAAPGQNEVLVRVTNGGVGDTLSEDAEGFDVYAQTIGGISAEAEDAQVPGNGTTDVTVTVTDQNGQPVAGAHVAPVTESGTTSPGSPSTGGYTNGRGEFTFTNATAGSHSYYVDASNNVGFTNGVDRTASVTVGSFTPRATTVEFTSLDGTAFDFDEYKSGDLSVTVEDQNGNPLANEFFFYSFQYTPFVPQAGTDVAQTFTGQAQTDSNGVATIALPDTVQDSATASIDDNGTGGTLVLSGFVNRDGTPPGQDAADLALEPQTIKVGESDVYWNGPDTVARQAGSDQTFGGTVELADGTTLGGRRLTVEYTPGDQGGLGAPLTDGDSVLAPQAAQPAGTTRVNNTSAIVVTQADGSFRVVVRDPAATAPAPQTIEPGAKLVATGTDTIPVTAPNTNDEGIGTDASDTVTVNWVANATPGNIELVADSDTTTAPAAENDSFEELVDNAATPGRPVTFRVRLLNGAASPAPLAGQEVTLTTDKGFFTSTVEEAADINNTPANGGLVPSPAPSAGSLYGEWVDNGKTTTVTTDDQGYAYVTVAIERDADFDDDGLATSTITATSGTATNAQPIRVQWTSANPLNVSSVEVAPDREQARVGDTVGLDVYAMDQFENLTAVPVTLSDNTADADIDDTSVTSQFENDDAVTYAEADEATTQEITGTWSGNANTYRDSSDAAGFQGVRNTAQTSVAGEATIDWYEAQITDETVTMERNVEGSVPVGTAVTETVTVLDSEGNPVPGVRVSFSQAGPGDANATNVERFTNADGEAYYTFLGASEGQAFISAVIETGASPVTKTDTVTFVGDNPPVGINLKAGGKNNGGKKDVLKVTANDNAAGLVAKVFVGGKKVKSHKLNGSGDFTFKIADKNGKKFTKYTVKVSATSATKADSASKKLR